MPHQDLLHALKVPCTIQNEESGPYQVIISFLFYLLVYKLASWIRDYLLNTNCHLFNQFYARRLPIDLLNFVLGLNRSFIIRIQIIRAFLVSAAVIYQLLFGMALICFCILRPVCPSLPQSNLGP